MQCFMSKVRGRGGRARGGRRLQLAKRWDAVPKFLPQIARIPRVLVSTENTFYPIVSIDGVAL